MTKRCYRLIKCGVAKLVYASVLGADFILIKGSIPFTTKFKKIGVFLIWTNTLFIWLITQWLEYLLDKLNVVGSNPSKLIGRRF